MICLLILTLLASTTATKWTEHTIKYDSDGEPIIESITNNYECALSCSTHGRLTIHGEGICGCKCNGQWTGKTCDTCPLEEDACVYGRLDRATCTCSNCQAPWTGPLCKTCSLSSSATCFVDSETCRCMPPQSPKEPQCQYQASDCQHGGLLNTECCQCNGCDKFWGGLLCNKCIRPVEGSCLNGGALDIDTCKCKDCSSPFGGEYCEKCMLEAKECNHGGKICRSSCQCHQCDAPWTGPRCNKCGLTTDDCQHGKVDEENEETCSCQCTAPWLPDLETGRCTMCSVTKETCGPGTVPDLVGCRCVGSPATSSSSSSSLLQVQNQEHRGKGRLRANHRKTSVSAVAPTLPPQAGTLISCTWTGLPDHMEEFVDPETSYYGRKRRGYLQHLFVANECDGNILPDPRQGVWMASMHSVYSCGKPEQWSVLSPNEEDGPGIMWWNGQECASATEIDGGAKVRVDFFLPSKEYTKYLHRCVWQGAPERIVRDNVDASAWEKSSQTPGGLSRSLSFKPWTQSGIDAGIRTEPGDVGNGEGNTNTILDRFTSNGDARFWGNKGGKEKWGDSAPGYHRHVFTKSDCSNGLPPDTNEESEKEKNTATATSTTCMVSHRWGESCGCDGDWRVIQGGKTKLDGTVLPTSTEWYTGQECTHARVAADFFCPPNDAPIAFGNAVHTCTFEGEGTIVPCSSGIKYSNNAENNQGQCRSHTFGTDGKGCTNGAPGKDSADPASDCMVSVREFAQCGLASDLEVNIDEKTGNVNVNWYTSEIITEGTESATGTCKHGKVAIDVLCTGSCPRKCEHGGILNKQSCSCECKFPYSGGSCETCGLKDSDCHHNTIHNNKECQCVAPKDTLPSDVIWGGLTGDVCLLKPANCPNGGELDTNTCVCINCNAPFSGPRCKKCTRTQSNCGQGSSLNSETCACDINCKTWGPLCDRCPKGIGGIECSGKGSCSSDTGICQCDASMWNGIACEAEMKDATCRVVEYGDLTTFDGAYVSSWRGKGEVELLSRTLRDGTMETVNVLFGSGRDPLSGVTGVSIKSIQYDLDGKKETDTISVVGSPSSSIDFTTTTGIVMAGEQPYSASEQPSSFHVETGRISIRRTESGYEMTTSTLTIVIDTFTGTNRNNKNEKRTFFDVELQARLPTDGSSKGSCGNYDGNADNDFEGHSSGQSFISCSLKESSTSIFTSSLDKSKYIDGNKNEDGGAKCDSTTENGSVRFKTTMKQEAQTTAVSEVSEAEMVVAKSCTPGSDLMTQTIAGCSKFLPVGFPHGIKNMGDIKLRTVNKCYFVSCTTKEIKTGVMAAEKMKNIEARRQKCTVPKQERERMNAQPPASLALIGSRIKDGVDGVCLV